MSRLGVGSFAGKCARGGACSRSRIRHNLEGRRLLRGSSKRTTMMNYVSRVSVLV